MLARPVRSVRVERSVQWVIQPGVQGVLAEREATVRPSKEKEEGMGMGFPLLQRPRSSTDQPEQLGDRVEGWTADLGVWRPSVVPLEAQEGVRVGPVE